MDAARLESILLSCWGVAGADVEVLTGGMNSTAWQVRARSRRWALKLVPAAQRAGFVAGLIAAQIVDAAGIPSGRAVATLDGELCANVPEGSLALLEWVDGVALAGEEDDQPVIGSTLGAAHTALAAVGPSDAPRFHWIDLDAAHLDVEEWVRPAVGAAVDGWDDVSHSAASWGLLHGDPAPEAFLWDPGSATCGLIDWSSAFYGPLLYDLASAVLYVGGPVSAAALVDAYLQHGLIGDAEVDVGLLPMLRFRWAVQADYFARRLTANDLTGIADRRGNVNGLHDARRHLTG